MSKSSTITNPRALRVYPPIHPGEMLREEFLEPLTMTPYELAGRLGVPRTRIERLVREETGLSADTALRLAKFFGTTAEFWTNMQSVYELTMAERAAAGAISRIEPLGRSAA
jgi:addiction module HigA family antidote